MQRYDLTGNLKIFFLYIQIKQAKFKNQQYLRWLPPSDNKLVTLQFSVNVYLCLKLKFHSSQYTRDKPAKQARVKTHL